MKGPRCSARRGASGLRASEGYRKFDGMRVGQQNRGFRGETHLFISSATSELNEC